MNIHNFNTSIEKKGLPNIGNTCFANSIMQILFNTKELITILEKYILLSSHEEYKNAFSFIKLFMEVREHRNPQSVHQFFRAGEFQKSGFAAFEQQDAQEFYSFVMDKMHESIQRKVDVEIKNKNGDNKLVNTIENIEQIKNKMNISIDDLALLCYNAESTFKKWSNGEYSEIQYLTYGISYTKLWNNSQYPPKSRIGEPEMFFMISFSMNPSSPIIRLKECFTDYLKDEFVDSTNGFKFDNTIPEEHNKKIYFWNLPKILVVQLKIFNYNVLENNNTMPLLHQIHNKTKINKPIELDFILDLNEFVSGYDKTSNIYELYGICCHIGNTLQFGHYISFIKENSTSSWICFNDDNVFNVQEDLLNNELNNNQLNPYLLFYRKKNN
jgi:ubiquitin C-terminal hydrolase